MATIMTLDKKLFYAGTYFPKTSRWGRPGLMELLPKIADVWRNDREKVLDSADRITQHIARLDDSRPGSNLDRQILDHAQAFFVQTYDPDHGGFGQSPKFPSAHQLSFLLRRYHQSQDPQTLAMVEKTLTQKRIHPFKDDKILTDWNGLMIAASAKAGSALDNRQYTAAAAKTADFILQNLTDDQRRLLK